MAVQPTPRVHKRVLYVGAQPRLTEAFFTACAEIPRCRTRHEAAGPVVTCRRTDFAFVPVHDAGAAIDALHSEFFNLVVLDLREPLGAAARRARERVFERGLALLDAMDREPDIERRYGFHRIVALVSGPDQPRLDQQIATLGARGVGRVMRDVSTCPLHPACERLPPRRVFARQVIEELAQICAHRQAGKRALCLSGGGITGLYFELGALKCLEDCCSPGALNEFDLYFGISAGGAVFVFVGMERKPRGGCGRPRGPPAGTAPTPPARKTAAGSSARRTSPVRSRWGTARLRRSASSGSTSAWRSPTASPPTRSSPTLTA